ESVRWALSTTDVGYWHPLTLLSHMLDCELFGLNPYWHHLTSLFIHVANTLLLFWILERMTGAVWASSFVAAAFAIHPLHVESVAWISERKDVLSGLFWMLTIAAYVRYAERPSVVRYLLVVLGLCAGLMAKPMVVTLPFVLLVLDYWPLARFSTPQGEPIKPVYQKSTAWRLIGEKIPLFVLIAVSCVVTYIVPKSHGVAASMEAVPLNSRIANALVSYVSYIWKMVYPHRLSVLYPLRQSEIPVWQAIGSLLVLAVVSAAVFYLGRKRRYLAVGWMWYVGTLVPVIGLVQVGLQAMADRYTYLPSVGIFIMIAWGVAELAARWRYRRFVLPVAAGLLLAGMLVCTRIQVQYWRNNGTLFGRALEVTENNYVMHNNYGVVLVEQVRFDEALIHFNEALRINPRDYDARKNKGLTLCDMGRFDEAVANLTEALRIRKDESELYGHLGFAYAQLGEHDAAAQCYNEALRVNPQDSKARNSLGRVFLAQGKFEEAITCFSEVLISRADWPDVYSNLGLAYAQLGDYASAVKNWTEAVELRPDSVDALNNLGWILAVTEDADLRNPDEAIKFAKRACELTGYIRVDFLDTLGVAYASSGSFPEAVKTAEKALELAESLEHKELMEEIRHRLDLYKVGQPYIESSSKQDTAQR
ncbi:MAG: tetratricopeptide repeat protein, partial [Planctomycetota bacterium]